VGKSKGDVHLYVDGVGVDPEDGGAAQAGKHDAIDQCKITRRSNSFEILRVPRECPEKRWRFCCVVRARTTEFLREGPGARLRAKRFGEVSGEALD
jgi:hypothetical protein